MLRRLTLCAALALAAPAAAQQAASMSADDAYVRSVKYTQDQYGKLNGDNAELKALLTTALAKLKDLETRAKANDAAAKSTLNDFAQGNTAKGVDALFVQAKAKAENSAAAAKAAAEDYKAAGALAFASDTSRAVAAYEAALRLAPGDADAAASLARLYERQGRYDEEARIADMEIASANPSTKARGYLDRGNAHYRRGDYSSAEAAHRGALDIATKANLKERQAQALGNLGLIAQDRGDLAGAEDYQKRALALNTELGSKQGQANALGNLGVIAYARGKPAEACDLFRRSLALYEGMGAGASQDAGGVRNNIAQFCPR